MRNEIFKMTLRMGLLASLAVLLSACSEGGKLNLKDPNRLFRKSAPGSEFVSSSSQFQSSLTRNYQVQQATGSFASKIQQTSSPSGYKLYYSVQGAVISDDL
jgi:hypothetical protein